MRLVEGDLTDEESRATRPRAMLSRAMSASCFPLPIEMEPFLSALGDPAGSLLVLGPEFEGPEESALGDPAGALLVLGPEFEGPEEGSLLIFCRFEASAVAALLPFFPLFGNKASRLGNSASFFFVGALSGRSLPFVWLTDARLTLLRW